MNKEVKYIIVVGDCDMVAEAIDDDDASDYILNKLNNGWDILDIRVYRVTDKVDFEITVKFLA